MKAIPSSENFVETGGTSFLLGFCFTVQTEAIVPSETLVDSYKSTRHYNSKDRVLHGYCYDNLKSDTEPMYFRTLHLQNERQKRCRYASSPSTIRFAVDQAGVAVTFYIFIY